jgi:NAD(P)-dependent dehydrogenase (short-subunit alcohol dehydrogenase family)
LPCDEIFASGTEDTPSAGSEGDLRTPIVSVAGIHGPFTQLVADELVGCAVDQLRLLAARWRPSRSTVAPATGGAVKMGMDSGLIALVTGASRGIGKAIAVRLADAGYDVAFTARTVHEGEGRTERNSVRLDEPVVAIPGSLEATEAEIVARGRRALPVRMDLLSSEEVVAAPHRVLSEWGQIDLLVNNAILQGGASMDRIADLTVDSMSALVTANYVHQVLLIQQVVPAMVAAGAGRIVNIVSGSARLDPPGPAGDGGWGIAYSASKAAFGRVAGGINAEFGPAVMAFNLDPGNVLTEKRKALSGRDSFEEGYGSESPAVTAAAVTHLATSDEVAPLLGKWIYAPKLSRDRGLS